MFCSNKCWGKTKQNTRIQVLWAFVSVVRKGTWLFLSFLLSYFFTYHYGVGRKFREKMMWAESSEGKPLSLPGERTFWAERKARAMGLRQNEYERTLCYTMTDILLNTMAARAVLKIRFYVKIILNTECCKGSTEFPYTPYSVSLINMLHYHGAFVKTKKPLYSDSTSFPPNVLCLFQDPI